MAGGAERGAHDAAGPAGPDDADTVQRIHLSFQSPAGVPDGYAVAVSLTRYVSGMSQQTWRAAVLLALPELAGWTDRWRTASYSSSRPELSIAERVPPHITVLVRWVAPDPGALDRLRTAVDGFGPHVTVSAEGGEPVLAEVRSALAETAPPAVRVDALTIWTSPDGGIWHPSGRVPL